MAKNGIADARMAIFLAVLRSPSRAGLRLLEAVGKLTRDYAPDQPRDENGRWTSGGRSISEKPLTSEEKSGRIQSFTKVVGKNGGTLKAEDMPEISSSKGVYRVVPGTKVTGIYNFAGKGAKSLRVEQHLIKQYGGSKGEWQHTAGNAIIDFGNGPEKAHIHWFQEPTIGIIKAKVKED